MKPRILLIPIFIFASCVANASDKNPEPGKKEDIIGFVLNGDTKKPLKDVSITAYLSSKKEKVVVTDESGEFSFDNLKGGVYKFVFEKHGYKKVVKENVTVKVDEGFQLKIEMLQDAEPDLLPAPSHFIYN
jgi:Carboxypeptidase regulatory-like domain